MHTEGSSPRVHEPRECSSSTSHGSLWLASESSPSAWLRFVTVPFMNEKYSQQKCGVLELYSVGCTPDNGKIKGNGAPAGQAIRNNFGFGGSWHSSGKHPAPYHLSFKSTMNQEFLETTDQRTGRGLKPTAALLVVGAIVFLSACAYYDRHPLMQRHAFGPRFRRCYFINVFHCSDISAVAVALSLYLMFALCQTRPHRHGTLCKMACP